MADKPKPASTPKPVQTAPIRPTTESVTAGRKPPAPRPNPTAGKTPTPRPSRKK